jgi:hypothetical protein
MPEVPPQRAFRCEARHAQLGSGVGRLYHRTAPTTRSPDIDVNEFTRVHSLSRIVSIATCAAFLLQPVTLAAQDTEAKPRLDLTPNRTAPPPPASPAPATGSVRADFVRNQAALGVALYAPAFATTITDDPLTWAASYVFVAGGSFVAASEISKRVTVTDAMQRLATGAPIRGAIAGSLLAALIDGDVRATAGAILAGSVGGTAAGLLRGQSMDDGEAAATLFGADVLGLTGYGLSTALGLRNEERSNRTRLAMSLGGMLAGAPLGQAYAALAPYNVTVGDIHAMSATGGVGMLLGLTAIANGAHSDREIAAALTIGGAVGLVAGDRLLTRRYDHSAHEGRMIVLGGVVGGAAGAGIALATSGRSRESWNAYSAGLATAGAVAGATWAQYYLRPKPDGVARMGAITINPIGVAALASGMNGSYTVGTIRF